MDQEVDDASDQEAAGTASEPEGENAANASAELAAEIASELDVLRDGRGDGEHLAGGLRHAEEPGEADAGGAG